MGIEGLDDAGVYKISDDLALVQTVDFFTPVVDDPIWFGRIAVANALSDIYAMGGIPKTAMNIVCFSPRKFDVKILRDILHGGLEKLKEAKVVLVGGHSVEDDEIKYGVAVTGFINPKRILKNEGAQPGDILVLTKPLGTGVMSTAIKAEILDPKSVLKVCEIMAELNEKGQKVMLELDTHAATDITGFGLIGHLKEMIKEDLGLKLYVDRVPIIDGVLELIRSGFSPGGLFRNRSFYSESVMNLSDGPLFDLLFDPQTSGGLAFAIPPSDLELLQTLGEKYNLRFWIIGEFTDNNKGKIVLV